MASLGIICAFLTFSGIFFRICTAVSDQTLVTTFHGNTAQCGDWTPYASEKCVKIFDVSLVDRSKGEAICRSAEPEDNSRLVTIKTLQEQQFLSEFVFEQNAVVHSVWLGINPSDTNTELRWLDQSPLLFSNWDVELNTSDKKTFCAQMQPGFEESRLPGMWTWAPCNKSNLVVCEKNQLLVWSLKTLQRQFMNLKKNFTEVTANLKKEIEGLAQSQSVPVDYIYIQLSYQLPPTDLWPNTAWIDVSAQYAGLFFRVKGETSADMDEIQPENAPRLTSVKYEQGYDGNPVEISANGIWSSRIYSGSDKGGHWGLRFIVSGGEVRPKNQAIRVWKRVK